MYYDDTGTFYMTTLLVIPANNFHGKVYTAHNGIVAYFSNIEKTKKYSKAIQPKCYLKTYYTLKYFYSYGHIFKCTE